MSSMAMQLVLFGGWLPPKAKVEEADRPKPLHEGLQPPCQFPCTTCQVRCAHNKQLELTLPV